MDCGLFAVVAACLFVQPETAPAKPVDAPAAHAPEAQAPVEGDVERLLATPSVASFDSSVPAVIEVKRAPTGHLLVRPVINGVQCGWFIFDTGAGVCVVSTPTIAALKLRDGPSVDAVGIGGAATKKLKFADTLTVGPLTLRDHAVMETDLSFLTPHLKDEIAGVIGFGVLSACVAEIDLETATIALHDPATYVLADAAWSPLILNDRVPGVPGKFEGHEGLFRLDTGANGSVSMHEQATRELALLDGRETREGKAGGVGGFVKMRRGTLAWIEFGGVRQENVPADFAVEAKGAFGNDAYAGNIGVNLLKQFVLVTDYTRKQIAFKVRPVEADAGQDAKLAPKPDPELTR